MAKLGEFIKVALAKGTKPVTIERRDMTDAEWEKVKKNASDSGHLVLSSGLPGGDAPVDLEKKLDPSKPPTEASNGVFPDRQNDTPDEPAKPQPAKPEASLSSDVKELKRVVSTLSEGVGPKKNKSGSFFDPDYQSKPADPNAETVSSGRQPPQQSGAGEFTTDPSDPTGGLVPVRRWQPKGTQVSPGVLKVDPVVDPELGPAPEPGFLEQVAAPFDALGKGLKSGVDAVTAPISRILSPSPSPEPQLADPTDAGMPTPAVVPPVQAPPPVTGNPPQGPGGSLSASVKTTTPGSGALPVQADPYAADRKKMESAAETTKAAHGKLAEVENSRAAAEARILDDKIKFTAQNEEKRLAAVNTYEETLARGQQTMNSIADERRQLMNTKVDPDAYYTKGGVGRGVLATISGALFGFTGQGPQFLQRLDNLAQQEVKNQQDELARKSDQLSLIAGDKKNVIAMAREAGMNQIESLAAARVSFYQSVQDQIAKAAAENPAFAAQAQIKLAEIDQQVAKESMILTQATQMAGHQNVQDRVAMMNANSQRMEASARMTAAGAKGAGMQEMKPGQQQAIQGLLSVGKQIGSMAKQHGEQAGGMLDAAKQFLGLGMDFTKASQWRNASAPLHAQSIGTVLEKGKLTDADFPKYLGSFIPSAGNTKEAALNKISNLVNYATTQYEAEINSLDAAMVRSIGLPTPAQYRAMLIKDIDESQGGGSVPGEKPYGAR